MVLDHQCDGIPEESHISHTDEIYEEEDIPRWELWVSFDSIGGEGGDTTWVAINFCPFCGVELDD